MQSFIIHKQALLSLLSQAAPDPSFTMSGSVNDGGTSVNAAPQVKAREDGTVEVVYASYVAYVHDQRLLKAAKTFYDVVADDRVAGVLSEELKT